jgi:hypothetical protein
VRVKWRHFDCFDRLRTLSVESVEAL